MVYKRFIQAGRVVYVANGKYAGKLVVVADVVDHGRALCENPVHGVPRQVFRFQDLNITDIAVNIPHGARGGSIKPVCDTQERLVCTYEPEETCRDEEKQYCHKVEKVVLEEECDMKSDTRYL